MTDGGDAIAAPTLGARVRKYLDAFGLQGEADAIGDRGVRSPRALRVLQS